MSATFAKLSEETSSNQTSEPADEVKMEAEDSIVVQTEQPVSAPSPVDLGGVPKAARSGDDSNAVKSTAKDETSGEGTSVDNLNLASKTDLEKTGNAKSDGMDKAGAMTDNTGQCKEKEKVDRLDRLAQQIEDFDPVSLLKSNGSATGAVESEFTRDINDEKLIDELVQNVNAEGKIDEISNEREVTPDDEEREVTPDGESEEDNSASSNALTDSKDALKPTDDAEPNGYECEEDELVDSNGIDTEKDLTGKLVDDSGKQENSEIEEKTETKQDVKTTKQGEKSQKHENASPTKAGKSKKKEDKSIDHILKALSSLQTTEEKLAALCKKYADLHEDHRNLQTSFKQGQRKITVISREKDQLQTEHTKAVMAKSKLESLCRELQKHNQTVRQESLQRAREEDEKRKEISQKFQTTIGEIQQQMQDNHEKNKQLREENFELANKLKKFIEQYEAREKQIEKVIQHRELEGKLADAKLEQATAILMEEKGKNQKEKELLLMQTTEYVKKLQIKEAELSMYKERYEEFQSTIQKSEEMFQKFKVEMDRMTKRCKKLEKDGVQWKSKWENANRALLEMAEEKTKYDKERPMLLNKITKLESLCRAMQAERKARKILEADGIDISKLTLEDDIPVPGDEPSTQQEPVIVEGDTASGGLAPSSVEPNTTNKEPESVPESDAGSCQSSASEQTGVTVIQQDSKDESPPDASQSNTNTNTESQSEPASEENGQSEQISDTAAS